MSSISETAVNTANTVENDTASPTVTYAPITVSPTSVTSPATGCNKYINVTCADTSWTAGGGTSWCIIAKSTSTTAKITVTSNMASMNSSTSARGMKVVCSNGPQTAWIDVSQEGNAYYDRSSMVTFYHQPPGACAFTCGAMCVHIPPETLIKQGVTSVPADWNGIAKAGKMTATQIDYANLQTVYNNLKSGYPVVTNINGIYDKWHWVVICEYHGDPAVLNHSNFYCLDPNKTTGEIIPLTSATNYDASQLNSFTIVVFK